MGKTNHPISRGTDIACTIRWCRRPCTLAYTYILVVHKISQISCICTQYIQSSLHKQRWYTWNLDGSAHFKVGPFQSRPTSKSARVKVGPCQSRPVINILFNITMPFYLLLGIYLHNILYIWGTLFYVCTKAQF